jgi:drug/metabolite transporter (DMT)-like permease
VSRPTATAVGFVAVLLWSLLALLTVATGAVPPFLLAALSLAIGGAVGLALILVRGGSVAVFRQPAAVWLVGICGLFGYHFFYFTALRNAPPAEAGLIAYLWPLLIVLLSGLLPGERLRRLHILGALAGLAGAALIVTRGGAVGFDARFATGYGAALVCACLWSGYSVLSRRMGAVPTDVVAGFCLASAALAAVAHVVLEETVWPTGLTEWLAVAALGVGPVGGAFYVWDVGVKRGDIQLLGVASYAAPLISTGLLVAAGHAEPTPVLLVSAALIVGGAAVAALGSHRPAATGAADEARRG